MDTSDLEADIPAYNGLIYTVDNVLVPGGFLELTLDIPVKEMTSPIKVDGEDTDREVKTVPGPAAAPVPAPEDDANTIIPPDEE